MFKLLASNRAISENPEENKVECVLNVSVPTPETNGNEEEETLMETALLLSSDSSGYNDSHIHKDYVVLKERIKNLASGEFDDNEVADIFRTLKRLNNEMYIDILNCMVNMVDANDVCNYRMDTHTKTRILAQFSDEVIKNFKSKNKVEPLPKFDNPPKGKPEAKK